jgi:mRNA interferase RelE/StbE
VTYRIETTREAERDLASLPSSVIKRVDARILSLETNPRPRGAKKIEAGGGLFCVRVGDYRIIYEIDDVNLVVVVSRVEHRAEAYRRS